MISKKEATQSEKKLYTQVKTMKLLQKDNDKMGKSSTNVKKKINALKDKKKELVDQLKEEKKGPRFIWVNLMDNIKSPMEQACGLALKDQQQEK